MRISFFLFYAFFLISIKSFGQNKYSKNDVAKDLDFLEMQLKQKHLGIYQYNSPENLELKFNQIKNQIPDSSTIFDAFKVLSQAISTLEDFHTSVDLPKKVEKQNKKRIPFSIRKFDNNFFIHFNGSIDSSILRKSEIVSINDISCIKWAEKFKEIYGTDNNNPISKEYYLDRSFSFFFTQVNFPTDSVKLCYKNQQEIKTVFVKTLEPKEINKNIKKRYKNAIRTNFEYKLIDSLNHTAYLAITSFVAHSKYVDIPGLKFRKMIKKRFKTIESQNITNLIIDFRGNGGGNIKSIARLTQYLSKDKFKLFDSLKISSNFYHKLFSWKKIIGPALGPIFFRKIDSSSYLLRNQKTYNPNSKYHFSNNLYVLMDGGSYSATTFTIGLWKDLQMGQYIGTQPGGANWGSYAGSWTKVKLPNTKIIARIPNMKINYWEPHKLTKTFFVQPDYKVEQSFEDFMKREDTQLKFTEKLIQQKNNK